ncbi:hypothetical protein PoB_002794000 [Plakobranchus ocellatus]|uniref:Uncharacterized protein n=1 Tax=Plakobranchus ocellatus TaxID=259542 RepID=A0AAV3ZZY8_9GAST|nr:hypothetical protein PoB_002794000 [Plakobranchus ocellatus]
MRHAKVSHVSGQAVGHASRHRSPPQPDETEFASYLPFHLFASYALEISDPNLTESILDLRLTSAGGPVDSDPALRSARTLQATPVALWPN